MRATSGARRRRRSGNGPPGDHRLRHGVPPGAGEAAGGHGVAVPRARLAGAAGRDGRAAAERGGRRPRRSGSAGLDVPRQALCTAAGPGRDRVHGSVLGRAAGARAAPRRRRLGHQALPSRGADRPRRGRRPAPQARRRARREGARCRSARSRSAPTSSRPSSAARRSSSPAASSSSSSCWPRPRGRSCSARRSTSASGATPWSTATGRVDVFVRKLRSKLEKASPSWRYIHTHFGIGYRFSAEPAGRRVAGRAARAGRAPRRPVPAPEYEPAH